MGYVQTIAIIVAILTLFFSIIEPVAGASKLEELITRQESNLIIDLNKQDFIKYVLEEHKDYDLIVYYTLSANCEHCVLIEGELEQVSNSYIKAGKHRTENNNRIPVFFVKFEYNQQHQDIFMASEFQSVPILTLATNKLAKQYQEKKKAVYSSKHEWKISSQDFHDAGKLLEHVNKITNLEVELKYTFYRIMAGNTLIFGACAVLFFFKDKISTLLQNKIVWIIGTAIIYVQCIGGVAFNLIHRVPTFKYGSDGSGGMIIEEYFQRNQRSQYAGEGFMASSLMLLIGSLMIVFLYLNRVKDGFKREVLCMVVIAVVFTSVIILQGIFQIKASFYSPSFSPPEHYQKGPLSNDQGTNI